MYVSFFFISFNFLITIHLALAELSLFFFSLKLILEGFLLLTPHAPIHAQIHFARAMLGVFSAFKCNFPLK